MVVSCPACSTRVRLDRQKFSGKRIKLRCVQCGEIFVADVPLLKPSAAIPSDKETGTPLVLVAHSDPDFCSTVGDILAANGLSWQACHDGTAALQLMEAAPPAVVMVDVALPGLFAFEVVDTIRQRPGLKDVRIILISSVYNKFAYKRRPHTLYGADDYIEKHHISSDLLKKIVRLLPAGSTPSSAGQSAAQKQIDDVNNRLKLAEETEINVSSNDALVVEKAERLARIIASDIALYNQSKVEEGIRTNRFYELLASEIAEGKKHFLEHVPSDVPAREAMLQEAFDNLIAHRRRELKL